MTYTVNHYNVLTCAYNFDNYMNKWLFFPRLMEVHSQMIGSMQNRFFHFSVSESKWEAPRCMPHNWNNYTKKTMPTIIQQQCWFWNLQIRGSNQIFEYHFPSLITKNNRNLRTLVFKKRIKTTSVTQRKI